MKSTLHFINLTNGIQAIKEYRLIGKDYRFIRLQSTACEQRRWDDIIKGISDDLLLNLALGNKCIIYDYGAGKQVPRSIWQGVEWIKFALNKRWFHSEYKPQGRMSNSGQYFNEVYRGLSARARSKLRYYKKYLNTSTIDLEVVGSSTDKDSNIEYYRSLLLNIIHNSIKVDKKMPLDICQASPVVVNNTMTSKTRSHPWKQ